MSEKPAAGHNPGSALSANQQPDILVLDEASSALDDDTERQIMDGLRDLAQDLTIIAVTHRMSSIQSGDQVVRLNPKP